MVSFSFSMTYAPTTEQAARRMLEEDINTEFPHVETTIVVETLTTDEVTTVTGSVELPPLGFLFAQETPEASIKDHLNPALYDVRLSRERTNVRMSFRLDFQTDRPRMGAATARSRGLSIARSMLTTDDVSVNSVFQQDERSWRLTGVARLRPSNTVIAVPIERAAARYTPRGAWDSFEAV